MPIDISTFAMPTLTRLQPRYPMSYNKEDRYCEINPMHFAGRYQGNEGREGGFKFGGYNPNSQSTRVERIKIRSDDITLRPY
jgi:hypothetical protein